MTLKIIIRILVVCFAVTATAMFLTKVYGNVSLLSMPSEQIKYLGSDELSMYIKNGQNKSFIDEIIYSFNAPWFWEFTVITFFSLFIPMVIASSILIFGERYYQRKT